MFRFFRLFAVFLLASFAVGTIAHAAGATEMSVRMAAVTADAEMGDCRDCTETDGEMLACGQTCVLSLVALAPPESTEAIAEAIPAEQLLPERMIGRMRAPERHPPR